MCETERDVLCPLFIGSSVPAGGMCVREACALWIKEDEDTGVCMIAAALLAIRNQSINAAVRERNRYW